MIILRQKIFTFQDKKAWEELKRETNNFKDLPQGRKGMKPRDVFKLQDLAEKVGGGELSKVNWEEARKSFENIGLPETGKGLRHLSHKYQLLHDPEVIKRFASRYSDPSSKPIQKKIGTLDREYEVDRKKLPYKSLSKKYKRLSNSIIGGEFKEVNPISEFINPEEQRGLQHKAQINYIGMRKKGNRPVQKHIQKTINIPIKVESNRGVNSYTKDGIILTSDTKSPYTLSHEIGHHKHRRAYERITGKSINTRNNPLSILANENGATSHALSQLNLLQKQRKIRNKDVITGKKQLEEAYKAYLHNFLYYTSKIGRRKLYKLIKK